MLLPRTCVADAGWIAAQDPADWLTDAELTALDAWPPKTRRAEWLAGRLAAKRLLSEELEIAPLSWSVGRDGVAPTLGGLALPHLCLSLSHSAGAGAATVSDIHAEGSAGIDIQRIRPVHPGLCARVFTARERTQIAERFGSQANYDGLLLLWSLKEAAIKSRRLPWPYALKSIEVCLTDAQRAAITLPGEPMLAAEYARWGEWWAARAVRPAVR